MQYADYSAFRQSLYYLLEGEELDNTFSPQTMDILVGLGEGRVYNGDAQTPGLRASTMVEPLSAVVTDNAAPLPAGLLALKEVYFDGEPPLEIVPLDRLRRLVDASPGGSTVRYAAQDGDSLVFWPEASGTVLGSYYARPTTIVDMADADWPDATTFARYPELFTYACLIEAASFLGQIDRAPAWEARYRQLAAAANTAERLRVYGGGGLRMRSR